jgi:hypothetical protein
LVGEKRGQLLKAIAEIVSKHPGCTSDRSIAFRLKDRPEYKDVDERTLRRWIREAIKGEIGLDVPLNELDKKMLGSRLN